MLRSAGSGAWCVPHAWSSTGSSTGRNRGQGCRQPAVAIREHHTVIMSNKAILGAQWLVSTGAGWAERRRVRGVG